MLSDTAILIITSEIFLIVLAMAIALYLWRQKSSLKNFEKMFHDSIDAPGHGLIFFDENDDFKVANAQAYEFLPFLKKEDAPKKLKDFLNHFYDRSVDVDESLMNTLYRSGSKNLIEGYREIIITENRALCLVEAQNTNNDHTILLLHDVSEIQKQEENYIRLIDQNHELRNAVDAATSGIIMVNLTDPENSIVFANEAFSKQLMLKPEHVIGQPALSLINRLKSDDDKAAIIDSLDSHIALDMNVAIEMKGETYWFNFRLTPVEGRAGSLGLFIGVLTDITELRRHEDAMFQSQKLEALGQLSAGVAHDFNNILSIIDGYARFSGKDGQSAEQLKSNMDKIQASVQRGASLVQKMMAFSRTKIPQREAIDLVEAVQDQKTLFAPMVDASVQIDLEIKPASLPVACSLDDVSQVLMNMVLNARDAMPDGGRVTIKLDQVKGGNLPFEEEDIAEDYALLSIADTGEGMDEDVQKKIFDPFFTTKDQGKGTGLGLSMVYGLIKQANGFIDVESTLYKGTCFKIYLPIAEDIPIKSVIRDVEDLSELRLEGYTVLVAEDEPDLLDVVSGMLEGHGLQVLKAANGDEALVLQDDYDGKIDLLLTDIVMPGMNGVKMAELFQSLREETECIFMSGYPARGTEARVEIPENAHFISKPIAYDELMKIIHECLKNSAKNTTSDRMVMM